MFEAADTIVTVIDAPRSPEDFEEHREPAPVIAGPDERTCIAQGPEDGPMIGLAPLLTLEPDDDEPATQLFNRDEHGWDRPHEEPCHLDGGEHATLRDQDRPDFLRENSQLGWGEVVEPSEADRRLEDFEAAHDSRRWQRDFDAEAVARARAAAEEAEEAARQEAIVAARDVASQAVWAAEAASDFGGDELCAGPVSGAFDVDSMPPLEDGMDDGPSVQLDQALFATGTPHPDFELRRAIPDSSAARTPGYQPPASLFHQGAPAPSIRDVDVHRMDHRDRAPGQYFPPGRHFESANPPAYYKPRPAPAQAGPGAAMAPAYEDSSDLPWFVKGEDKPTRAEPPRSHFPDLPQTLITIPPEAGRVSPYHSIEKHAEPGESSAGVDLRPGGIIGWLRRKVKP